MYETEMREWLLDCFTEEDDQEQIQELSYEQLVRSVNRYHDNGFNGFLATIR